jgi:N-acetylglucosaminyldiphosphoundecaprenol N-acetyl-beta-D-mannosaminyltransferase
LIHQAVLGQLMTFPEIERANILGVGVDAIKMETAVRYIQRMIDEKDNGYISVVPAHTVMECQHDEDLRNIVNRGTLATPDGMSIVWLMKLRGFAQVERVYGPDLLLAAGRFGLSYGWRHFFYGGLAGVGQELSVKLQARLPGLKVAGIHSPPFRPLEEDEDERIISEINASKADIIWVGLSSPKQEFWMADHLGKIIAPVMVGVGAAFDFLSGRKPQAPRWMQRSGFEWLFRMITEPRRLWPRYRQYPKFGLLALAQLLGIRDFPLD